MQSIVRSERAEDSAAVRALYLSSFPTEAEALLVTRLRDSGAFVASLVASVENRVVGHIGFSRVTADGVETGVGLAPLAVESASRGQGIGSALVRDGLARCRRLGYGWSVVLGDPKFYRKFGFEPASRYGLEDEYGGQDAFQAVELIADQLPRNAGLVRYAAEFGLLE